MNLLNSLSPALRIGRDETAEHNVGTVEEPLFLSLADHPRALTGRDGQRQTAYRLSSLEKNPEADVVVPRDTRRIRRAQGRAASREQRKGQRAYVRRQLLKERVVGDLVQQFNILDGHVPARPETVERVSVSLSDKVDLMVAQAKTAGRELTDQQAWSQLRGLASGKVSA